MGAPQSPGDPACSASTLTDTFGPKYAATNYGFLYIAQGVGSILGGPAAAFLKQTTGSWTAVFVIVAILDIVTALLAVTVLRAMRNRHMQASWQFPNRNREGPPGAKTGRSSPSRSSAARRHMVASAN